MRDGKIGVWLEGRDPREGAEMPRDEGVKGMKGMATGGGMGSFAEGGHGGFCVAKGRTDAGGSGRGPRRPAPPPPRRGAGVGVRGRWRKAEYFSSRTRPPFHGIFPLLILPMLGDPQGDRVRMDG